MPGKFACMAGGPLCRALESGQLSARELGRLNTPFGPSEVILRVDDAPVPFYLMPRQLPGGPRLGASQINYRATLYALKDLGVEAVLNWAAAGAVTHDLGVGQILLPSDLIDLTSRRPMTFFEKHGLGLLRQFPVFCPALRGALEEVLAELKLDFHTGGTAAVTEGPRLETPAEVRMLAGFGAEVVTHMLAPEVFLAKELQMCLAGACYLVNYAETGSRYRPFSTGELFGGLTTASQAERLRRVCQALPELLRRLAEKVASAERTCECHNTMAGHIHKDNLPEDWHRWFD
jgi:5'-methylthioadenosine phosphorylase